jgi:curved DNA-binding protein CbpA
VSEPRDPYDVLQVASTVDNAVLRAAYRALARRYHPDLAGSGGESRMRELNAAWEVIGTPEHRLAYDLARAGSGTSQTVGAAACSAPPSSAPPWTGAAGPPPGNPSGSVLDFGVYYRWSVGEIARYDVGYLQWLEQKREGRAYVAEIDALLRRHGLREAPRPDAADPHRRGHRLFGR